MPTSTSLTHTPLSKNKWTLHNCELIIFEIVFICSTSTAPTVLHISTRTINSALWHPMGGIPPKLRNNLLQKILKHTFVVIFQRNIWTLSSNYKWVYRGYVVRHSSDDSLNTRILCPPLPVDNVWRHKSRGEHKVTPLPKVTKNGFLKYLI